MKAAAKPLFTLLGNNTDPVIGLATGGTFEPFYAYVAAHYKEEGCTFSRTRSFNLDEYLGISPENDQSYHYYMNKNLFSKVDIKEVRLPDANPIGRIDAAEYDNLIRDAGGIDLQYLGIGVNGHIGFNEPGTGFDSKTHVVSLTESTIAANARFFANESDVPRKAVTMGISTILGSRKIVLIATGKSKSGVIRDIAGVARPTETIPATALTTHPNASFYLDGAAAAELDDNLRPMKR